MEGMVLLWKHRNLIVFDNKRPHLLQCKIKLQTLYTMPTPSKKEVCMVRRYEDSGKMGFLCKTSESPKIERKVVPTDLDIIKINTDGASKGNPGEASYGAIFRNSNCEILQVLCRNIGFNTCYIAEIRGILEGIEEAVSKGGIKFGWNRILQTRSWPSERTNSHGS
ncbi:hypothetical protein IFM89_031610 [Coptis chinensis]|uniref:RNase H type-1 domain-containing protein n=1 Tax=Coptis chinensis TaxID=261450 RepID=A0A835HA28_9MAGN|nr:hypothetical protein IFM89_031610 [Coptis chinensis]